MNIIPANPHTGAPECVVTVDLSDEAELFVVLSYSDKSQDWHSLFTDVPEGIKQVQNPETGRWEPAPVPVLFPTFRKAAGAAARYLAGCLYPASWQTGLTLRVVQVWPTWEERE